MSYHENTKWLARIAGLFSFVFVSIVLLTITDSIYQEPPLIEVSSDATVVYSMNHKMLQVHRRFDRQNDHIGTTQGELRSDKHPYSLHLPDSTIEHNTDFIKLVLIPDNFKGIWCIDSELRFSYRLSIRSHTIDLKDVCVDIRETP